MVVFVKSGQKDALKEFSPFLILLSKCLGYRLSNRLVAGNRGLKVYSHRC